MRHAWLLAFLFLKPLAIRADEKDSLYLRLHNVLDNKEYYAINKEQNVRNIKQLFFIGSLSLQQKYEINAKLYEEYVKYQSDSAVHYVIQNQEIARKLGEKDLQYETAIRLAGLYSTKGMYIESKELLDRIDPQILPQRLLSIYYETCTEFYSHYGQSNGDAAHYRRSDAYRDSLLLVLDPQTLPYRIADASRKLFQKDDSADRDLLRLLEQTSDKDPERATIAFLLGSYYKNRHQLELQKYYFSLSAITDIVNCIKDNASLNSLALTYYALGNVNMAQRFFQAAMDDAVFCNVRYRASEIAVSYPIINESYRAQEELQKERSQLLIVTYSILLPVLIGGMIFIFLQMKRLSRIRKELFRSNQKLVELNNDLIITNKRLQESNRIKEEYISHFFDLCSTYINKLESYRRTLNRYAIHNRTGELFKMLRSNDLIENELEELYNKFDNIFLNLYPNFIEEYCALQLPGEPLVFKVGELLNTELRVFALIRLGITDSVKIAGFLRYSISTIYNYRVKARNNASVPRDQFEEQVMEIGKQG